MKHLYRFDLTLLVFIVICSETIWAETITLAVADEPPWAYRVDKRSVGIEVDIVRAISKDIGRTLIVKHYPVKRMVTAVVSGDADVLLFAGPSVEKINAMLPDNLLMDSTMIFRIRVSAFSLKDKGEYPLNQLESMRVGHLSNIEGIENSVLSKDFLRLRVNSDSQLVKTLIAGRIDVAVAGYPGFMYAMSQLGVENDVIANHDIFAFPMYPIWSKLSPRISKELMEEFSKSIQKIKHNGEMSRVINRYSDEDYFLDYGTSLRSTSP